MELWQLYLLVTIPSIKGALMSIGGLCLAGAVIITAIRYVSRADEYSNKDGKSEDLLEIRKTGGKYIIIFVSVLFASALLPGKAAIYTIAGGYLVTNVEGIEKLPPNMMGAANSFLEKFAKEQAQKLEK